MPSFERTGVVPATPEQVYAAWVDGAGHAAMTGADASSDPRVGGRFRAWGGYISGTYTALEAPFRLAFRWRTSQWPEEAEDSLVDVELRPHPEGCTVTIRHRGIPDGQPDYDQGWLEHYLQPMQRHFAG